MFLAKVVPLVSLLVSGVWAQTDQAQCATGFEWVCIKSAFSNMNQGDVTAQCSGFLCGSYRTAIPSTRMLALLVPHWMHRAVVLVGRVVIYIFRVISEVCCLLPVVYNYPPINSSQYYLPPSKNHSGDLGCDCNTVMYKYEVQSP